MKKKKGITYHNQVRLIPEMQEWVTIHRSNNVTHHINRMKDKKQSHDHLNKCKKII